MPVPLDLRFQQFTHYHVQGKGQKTGHGQFWICQCVCGQQKQIHEAALVEGRATGCGCRHVDKQGRRCPAHDLTGQQYGAWLVLRKRAKSRWVCACVCGREATVYQTTLRQRTSRQCRACGGRGRSGVQVHRWYGHYFILERLSLRKGHAIFRCRCDLCGEEKEVRGSDLASGKSQSCGCGSKGRDQGLLHRQFGRLFVLAYAGVNARHEKLFRCQCSCTDRTIKDISGKVLLNGDTTSCGCVQRERAADTLRAMHLEKSRARRLDWTLDIMRQHATAETP